MGLPIGTGVGKLERFRRCGRALPGSAEKHGSGILAGRWVAATMGAPERRARNTESAADRGKRWLPERLPGSPHPRVVMGRLPDLG